ADAQDGRRRADGRRAGAARTTIASAFGGTDLALLGAVNNVFDYQLFHIGNTPVTAASLIVTAAILGASYLLGRLLRGLIANRLLRRTHLSTGIRYALGRFTRYIVFSLGAVVALQTLGVNATTLAAFGAALGVGIGFGLQDLVKNFVAGLDRESTR